jgi:hypothetical protein
MAKAKAVKAQIGERMIELKVYFWTNNIAKGKGKIIPKHAWSAGMVRLEPNQAHGIIGRKAKPFHTLFDLGTTIEKVLIQDGVVIHPARQMKKYLRGQ